MPVRHDHTPLPLHRVRFIDYVPSPIVALAFAPLPLPPARDPSTKGKGKLGPPPVPGPSKEEYGSLVAARENGDLEIWEWARGQEEGSIGNWILDRILPPTLTHPTISLMALVIRDPVALMKKAYRVPKIEDLRLFAAGSDAGELTERCLRTGRILATYPIPSPPLWSLSVSPTHTLLCLATTSPGLHFLSVPPATASQPCPNLETPPPHLLRSDALPSKARTVSIAWGPPRLAEISEGEWEWRDTYLVTGNSDSSFRKWEIPMPSEDGSRALGRLRLKSRGAMEKIRLQQKNGKRGGKGTIVWGVGVLPDHTIITADSLGGITFWDGASMAQKQSFKAHKADGMCLTIAKGGRTVFTSGPDQRVCQFSLVSSPNGDSWALTSTRRIHSHDVRALAVFPPYVSTQSSHFDSTINAGSAPVLASGGWDMGLVFTPAGTPDLLSSSLQNPLGKIYGPSKTVFDEAFYRKMSVMGGGRGSGRISVARTARLVVCRNDRSIGIWRVSHQEDGWVKVLDMELKLRTHLVSTAISDDGHWLAVSDVYETKLFRLVEQTNESLRPTRVRNLLETLSASPHLHDLQISIKGCGASSLLFTTDSQRLAMSFVVSGKIAVLQLSHKSGTSGVEVLQCFDRRDVLANGRVIKPLGGIMHKSALNGDAALLPNGQTNGHSIKSLAVTVPAANGHSIAIEGNEKSDDSSEDEEDEEAAEEATIESETHAWVACLAASDDSQWLASSDLSGQISIVNLDTLQHHATLPTLPQGPTAITFPPSQPSLLAILLPTGSLQFYHLEHRRLLPPSLQLNLLNRTLRSQYTPAQSITFEPTRHGSRSAKLMVWSHDWLATIRLDLDLIAKRSSAASLRNSPGSSIDSPSLVSASLRRKRAREAQEQLERVSASASPSVESSDITGSLNLSRDLSRSSIFGSGAAAGAGGMGGIASPAGKGHSSADDPEFCKVISDRFRAIMGVDWLGEGEMMVVERPLADYMAELPPAFFSGGFGRT